MTGPARDDERLQVAKELVRQAERSIDQQLTLVNDQQSKTAHATRTAIATLTAMVSGFGLLLHLGLIHGLILSIQSLSLTLASWVSARLILLSTGFTHPTRFANGIAPGTLRRLSHESSPVLQTFLLSVLERLNAAWRNNEDHIRKLTEHRDRQVLLLFLSLGVFLSTIVYTMVKTTTGG